MRITSEVMVTRSLERLQSRLEAYERSQSELSTGKKILRPSDDPGGARRGMSIRASMRSREQELRNANDAMGWLNLADSELQSGIARLGRARDLTVDAATLKDPGSQQAIAKELRQIAEELVGIANAKHLGRPLFGGYSDEDAVTVDLEADPIAITFDPPDGTPDRIERRVSDTEKVRVNVTAAEWLGAGGPDGDLIGVLYRLADDIEAGDQQAATTAIGALDRARETMAASLADIGAATNRVTSAQQRAQDGLLTLRTELSNVEDVDVAAGIMELQVQEIGYQATLQALSKALPPSLVSFLR